MRKILWVLVVLLIVVGAAPTMAQSEETPLMDMLARIPAYVALREYVSYIDYHALLTTRNAVPEIHSWQEFQAQMEGKSAGSGLLLAALNGARSGPDFLSRIMIADNVPGVLGFDFFQIGQAVTFGRPPGEIVILQGDFDQQSVIDAHTARDYTQSDPAEGVTLLCPASGCENGRHTNLQNREPSNLFGGALGRSQPVLLGDGWIASSPSIDALGTLVDPTPSLADQADFHAAAEALTANGTLLQSWFINPLTMMSVSDILPSGRLTEEQLKALRERLLKDFVPMPPYALAVLADVVTEDEQQAVIALVYVNESNAEEAAALFPERLTNTTSLRTNRPFGDVIADRGVTSVDAAVYPASGGRYVVLVTLHAPLPSDTKNDEGQLVASSRPYGLLVDAYFALDLAWLAPTFDSP